MPGNKKQTSKKNSKINPVKAGLAGTAIVAAGVAAVTLSKKENRKKAGKVLKDLQVKGKKLTKRGTKVIERVMKDEELLRDTTRTALTAVQKAVRTSPRPKGRVTAAKVTKPKTSGKKTAPRKVTPKKTKKVTKKTAKGT